MVQIKKYFSLVLFRHTIFALPFALIAFVFAWKSPYYNPENNIWVLLLQVVACMVTARNVAMGFNRWADWKIDAANPRTAQRDIPAGRISPREALIFVGINALLFVGVAISINPLTAWLSPVALGVILGYSYCKRFTSLAHLVLGLSLGIAPAGAYIAVTGRLDMPAMLLSLLVLSWCGGFDIIYALQDADFDRQQGLHSIPARFSARTSLVISALLHVVSFFSLLGFATYCPQGGWLWIGCTLFTLCLILQHLLVTPTRQRNIGIAFQTLNGIASLTLAGFVILQFLLG